MVLNHIGIVTTIDFDQAPRSDVETALLANASMMVQNPFVHALIYASGMIITVFASYFVGRMAGGTGGFGACISVIGALGFVWAAFSLLQIVSHFVSLALAGILSLLTFVLMMWILTNAIAELHEFKSLFKVFVMIFATFFGFLFGMSFIIQLIFVSASSGV